MSPCKDLLIAFPKIYDLSPECCRLFWYGTGVRRRDESSVQGMLYADGAVFRHEHEPGLADVVATIVECTRHLDWWCPKKKETKCIPYYPIWWQRAWVSGQ